MTREIGPPGSLQTEGGFITAGMKVHKESGRIVLLKKTRLWFRAAICFWAMFNLFIPFMIYSEWFSSQTTRFICDRGTGVCTVNGQSKDSPPLADIRRAEMDHDFNRRDGANWGINLVARDGKKYPIEQQRAIKDSVVAEYRSAVATINSYLANPGQQKLDVSYTYVAGLSEKLKTLFYFLFGVVTLAAGLGMWSTRRYIFEREKVTFLNRGPLQRFRQELATQQISAIIDRVVAGKRRIELKVDGDYEIAVASAGLFAASKLDPLAADLAGFIGKPVERTKADQQT
jgi:hypothetical protein